MSNSAEKDQIIDEIIVDMPLKEKVAIAKLDEEDIPYLQYAFDICVSGHLGQDGEIGKDFMHRMWEVLKGTHRIRRVK